MLALRTIVQQLGVLAGGVVLARSLDPADFGVYGICLFVLAAFGMFGNGGLGAALIQRREEPTHRELSSVFWAGGLAAVCVTVVLWAFASRMRAIWPQLPTEAPTLLRLISADILISQLRVVPTVLMERRLRYGRLAAIETASQLSFYGVAVPLAYYWHLKATALVVGAVVEATVELLGVYALQRFRPSLVLDARALGPILRFGAPYQLTRILELANAAVTPLYAGMRLGTTPVGLLRWSRDTADFSNKLVSILGRVTFSLYSRLQDQPAKLAEAIGHTLYIAASGTFLFAAIMFGMGRGLVSLVFTAKWLAAMPTLHVYLGAGCLGFLVPVVASALDATGRPRTFARLAVGWTVLNWVAVPIGTQWGMRGFAMAHVAHIIVGGVAALVVLARTFPDVNVAGRLWAPAVAATTVFLLASLLAPYTQGPPSAVGGVAACLLCFVVVLFAIDRRGARAAVRIVTSGSPTEARASTA